ncbi:MAG: GTP-dependent dephospho-CoA kinase family protein [Ignisphaera sp.]|nr:GTP-dependent dephospho-CoA kinase family protein [Ignisphaera sp.]MCX8167866.1 GTP-dependent dephospho-CoA kinase family protein [Ignisphaera sp.]MDW8085493.1 DUF359 domain-containing protein [Ignisphaera sp.]
MIVVYEMPSIFRAALSNPHIYLQQGTRLLTGLREAVAHILRSQYYSELYSIVVVGDYVCETFIRYVGIPRLCIVDGKTLRYTDVNFDELKKNFRHIETCRNPPGYISRACLEAIRICFKKGVESLILVDGEEDLLALASLITIPHGYVIYGIPHLGVAISDVLPLKTYIINIFSHFKPIQVG